MKTRIVVVTGVSGSGKSSVGAAVARALSFAFAEGDSFHPEANVAKMAAGTPLTDDDRRPWLERIASWIAGQVAAGASSVVSCSALKRSYRDILRRAYADLELVFLHGNRAVLESRMAARRDHFFPALLLDSQLAELEPPSPDEGALFVDVASPLPDLVDEIVETLRARRPGGR